MRFKIIILVGTILFAAILYFPSEMGLAAVAPQGPSSQALSLYLPLVLKPADIPASGATPTPTSTTSPTVTGTPGVTPTPTPADTPAATGTDTPSGTPSDTPAATGTDTPSATPSDTPTATGTDTPSGTPSDTPAATGTDTPSATPSDTPAATGTDTPSATPSDTPTATGTHTPTAAHTPTFTPTKTRTPTPTATNTASPTTTFTPTNTGTPTPTASQTGTPTATFTPTVTDTPTETGTPTETWTPSPTASSFTFASLADAHAQATRFTQTIDQVKSLDPAFILLNGDYTNDGIYANDSNGELNKSTSVLDNAGLFSNAFIVRGNHDNSQSGSSANWSSFFNNQHGTPRSLPPGVTNYAAMDANSTYLTYSFDYDNSRFIGLDVPGDVKLLTAAQYSFMDARLTDAEALGLTHAFLYFHGPEYCVENTHCECTARSDASCTPSAFVTLVNKHPIISATFHGHEHALVHVHMDSTRLSALTNPYEEFITSSAGMPYSFTTYTNRVTDSFSSSSQMSFGLITVNGPEFTVSFYRVGISAPVWTKTFTK